MSVPKPPAPIYAATTETLITVTAAMRMPATITGSASGTSTFHRICAPLMPIPRAASTTSAGVPRIPVAMLRIRISSEKQTITMIALVLPSPTIGIINAKNASVGIVYRNPEIASAARYTTSRRAAHRPMAKERTKAITNTDSEIKMCSYSPSST